MNKTTNKPAALTKAEIEEFLKDVFRDEAVNVEKAQRKTNVAQTVNARADKIIEGLSEAAPLKLSSFKKLDYNCLKSCGKEDDGSIKCVACKGYNGA